MLTDKDRELLALLSDNSRMPVATLAKKLRLSRTTVQARLERLEREGVIAGYGVRLSDPYASSLIRAHILITIAPKALSHVVSALDRLKPVTALHSVSGNFDLIAIVAAPSITELDQILRRDRNTGWGRAHLVLDHPVDTDFAIVRPNELVAQENRRHFS